MLLKQIVTHNIPVQKPGYSLFHVPLFTKAVKNPPLAKSPVLFQNQGIHKKQRPERQADEQTPCIINKLLSEERYIASPMSGHDFSARMLHENTI